jgi:hypothetical protein
LEFSGRQGLSADGIVVVLVMWTLAAMVIPQGLGGGQGDVLERCMNLIDDLFCVPHGPVRPPLELLRRTF